MFKSKQFRVVLSILSLLVLVGVVGGFALSRGYLMHFLIDDQTISRDEFLHLADEAVQNPDIHVACAQGELALGWLYVYESHCFSSDTAVEAYMKARYGT